MNKSHKHIGVAIIINDKKEILIDRRLPTGVMANLWEFPGGKIERGETPEDCIIREIKEELGVVVRCDRIFAEITHDYEQFTVTLYVYLCHICQGKPQPLECAEILWVKPHELSQFEFPSANQEIISKLQKEFS
ncbi:8-oxo-dGTP diphosphatase MutT [Cyanobacterium aponinum UTEX 3222]|uniref:8-oxo-dGTP diphosphatase n=2 Tax=Cyanobacterium aponinum TaxID=379064 RepID=K9Z7M4_CYAAP|nr:8-oxo-dGTP diphosphatase MutT [Cyanobacterium aponinum]WRL43657.1 8-oxo-dGTP diphosphatase MutT [Cyanobacterium aponinum UTEX 3222]AFZ54398.1 8-oxo-dGTPase [Cyanobacterium aponinum PCC 10605]MBD2394088.1 8-oxo-dGTP diphosphatase MutT [Cyanobacterium aponinum FACHB-4101]MTF38772.1 8-oxo-dGTP diphosphatase MutT [Cyanobacterium aponinum 0216]WRL37300.1 8-oxo-dGTP diphosphatase MutT [Cyanobacterium aponinum UTEX 3221]